MMSHPDSPTFDWSLWLQWVLVSTLGWVVGRALVGEVGVGVAVGALQWIVLRPLIRGAAWWILASGVGWATGWAMVVAGLPPERSVMAGAVLGAAIGTAQWLVLRRQLHRTGWWIVISTLSWAVGLTGIPGPSLVGGVVGAATGLALERLLRHPRPET